MGKVFLALAALAAIWLLPAEAHADDGDEAADEPGTGKATPTQAAASFDTPPTVPDWVPEQDDGFGVREHRLRVVPRGTPQPDVDRPYVQSKPEWPGEHLQEAYKFADAYSFPELFPKVSGAYQVHIGKPGGDPAPAIFSHRVDLELYALHVGLSLYDAVGAHQTSQQTVDLDARVPLHLAEHLWLSLLPGVSFDAARIGADPEVRAQGVFGWGWEMGSLQGRLGYTEGPRAGGILMSDGIEKVSAPGCLFGALAALRPLKALELRAEVSGEVFEANTNRLSLLPGAAFYPFEDERLELGLVAVVESREKHLGLKNPDLGGLFRMALAVY